MVIAFPKQVLNNILRGDRSHDGVFWNDNDVPALVVRHDWLGIQRLGWDDVLISPHVLGATC